MAFGDLPRCSVCGQYMYEAHPHCDARRSCDIPLDLDGLHPVSKDRFPTMEEWQIFRGTLEVKYSMVDHEKAPLLWALAWEDGHESCKRTVEYYYVQYGQLVQGFPDD